MDRQGQDQILHGFVGLERTLDFLWRVIEMYYGDGSKRTAWSDSHIYRYYRLLYEESNSYFLGASWMDRCTYVLIAHPLQALIRATAEVPTSGVKIKILDWWDVIGNGHGSWPLYFSEKRILGNRQSRKVWVQYNLLVKKRNLECRFDSDWERWCHLELYLHNLTWFLHHHWLFKPILVLTLEKKKTVAQRG